MKLIFTFLLLALPLAMNAQTFSSAVDYNDHIVELQRRIGVKMMKFNEELSSDAATLESVNAELKELQSVADDVISNCQKLPAYEKNTALRDAAMDLFKYYKKTFKEDYSRMVQLIYGDELTEESIKELEAILEKVTVDEKVLDERFMKEQTSFADKHGFSLGENELQEQIDSIDK